MVSVSLLLPMGKALSLLYVLLVLLASIPLCAALFSWTFLFLVFFPFVPADAAPYVYHGVPWVLVLIFAAKNKLLSAEVLHRRLLARYAGPVRSLLFLVLWVLFAALILRRVPLWELFGWISMLLILRHTIEAPPKARPRLGAATALLCMGSLLLSLSFAEVAARFISAPAHEPPPYFITGHPRANYMLRPDTVSQHFLNLCDGSQTPIPTIISSQGLRDRLYGPKEEGEYRILLLGDSFTMGWGLPVEHTISRMLERHLRAEWPGRNITVINAGAENYGPWQERYFLQERGFPLEPDLVIHQLFPGNDVENTLAKIGKLPESYCRDAMKYAFQWAHRGQWQFRFERQLKARSALYRLVLKALPVPFLAPEFRLFGSSPMPELPPSAPRPFSIETSLRDWYPLLNEGWQLLEDDILSIRKDCQDRNVGYLAYTIPDVCNAYDGAWDNAVAMASQYAYERYKASRLMEAFFKREQIQYANVHTAFIEHPDTEKLYFICDGHLTRSGVDVVAQELAAGLAKHGFIGEGKL